VDLATAGNYEKREGLRWYTPLLHLDTHVKLVQYIKLAMPRTHGQKWSAPAPAAGRASARRLCDYPQSDADAAKK